MKKILVSLQTDNPSFCRSDNEGLMWEHSRKDYVLVTWILLD
jgi:hypothetical protein